MSNQEELDKLKEEIEQSLNTLRQIIEDLKYLNKSNKQWMITKGKNKPV